MPDCWARATCYNRKTREIEVVKEIRLAGFKVPARLSLSAATDITLA
jgi:hypothetical protein